MLTSLFFPGLQNLCEQILFNREYLSHAGGWDTDIHVAKEGKWAKVHNSLMNKQRSQKLEIQTVLAGFIFLLSQV